MLLWRQGRGAHNALYSIRINLRKIFPKQKNLNFCFKRRQTKGTMNVHECPEEGHSITWGLQMLDHRESCMT